MSMTMPHPVSLIDLGNIDSSARYYRLPRGRFISADETVNASA